MTLREFRDRVQWVALGNAFLIVIGQWCLHAYYVDREIWIDRTPWILNLAGFLLTLSTLLLGLVTLPRLISGCSACLFMGYVHICSGSLVFCLGIR